MLNRRRYKDIGSFDLSQPKMYVTDPGYDKDEMFTKVIDKYFTGRWLAYLNTNKYKSMNEGKAYRDERVAALFVCHERIGAKKAFGHIHYELPDNDVNSTVVNIRYSDNWELLSERIGVDSGQAGFFDYEKYEDNSLFKEPGKCGYGDKWYSNCCDINLNGKAGIVADCGVNCTSGFGDGCYCVWGHKHRGKYDALALFFLPENDPIEF